MVMVGLSQVSKSPSRLGDEHKPTVIGIFGIPGSGKSYLLDELKKELGNSQFSFHEGSNLIGSLVPGGLDAFQQFDEAEKAIWRRQAIDNVKELCTKNGKAAVIAGHFLFWEEGKESGMRVFTQSDWDTYTHIIYMNVAPETIMEQRGKDARRKRPYASLDHLRKWQQSERTELSHFCYQNRILFSILPADPSLQEQVSQLLVDFVTHDENHNVSVAKSTLDDFISQDGGQRETILVLDGDKTLAPQDTGILFWETVSSSHPGMFERNPLKALFSSPLGYSYTAFRQAVMLYEAVADSQQFEDLCCQVASAVTMYPDFVTLLKLVREQQHIGAVVITCGLRRVWEKVLEKEGLSPSVRVIGGGRVADGYVVTASVKAALVSRLRHVHKVHVWAFGDSPLDLDMLSEADEAVVVFGEYTTRSHSMESALRSAMKKKCLHARQTLLSISDSPYGDIDILPTIQLLGKSFLSSVLGHRVPHEGFRLVHATDTTAAKLLMTPMRNAAVAGPALREAHQQVGWYLGTKCLTEVVGLEEYAIPHVQGHYTTGHRLAGERRTCIVALMRGGEPMALGVNNALPLARFLHAKSPDDILLHHLRNQQRVVLVDSVINSGKTVVDFVRHIRKLHATIGIVILAGVVQKQAATNTLTEAFASDVNIHLIAMRLSDNKYTGSGGTDTGNRLFNTTDLE